MSDLKQIVSEKLLPFVRQPAQYLGGEINQLAEPGRWESAQVRVAIGFPDTYAVGMSHLGCQILYWICNRIDWACAERVYCPWIDAEQVMRREGIGLFTWDNRHPVCEADFLAVSVQYEVVFSNLLTMLDLAGIPLRSSDRREGDPIVLIGGPQADNPEPLEEFVDLAVIGDGEESLPALLNLYRKLKRGGADRSEIITELARCFAWCYAPGLYEVSYRVDGTVQSLRPRLPGLPENIQRCKVRDFETAPVPERPLIPWTETVHDRISIEIMRGCPQVCRFCHAGSTKKPVRYRSVERILQIAETAWQATGKDEIGLLSLSTADYPALVELAQRIRGQFEHRKVNISVPSLRVDKMLSDVPWLAASVRKAGLTIAVEAADEIMRRAIRKKVTDENLLHAVQEAYKVGWRRIKLYFMAGFPGETDEDITGIWQLACKVSEARRRIAGHPAAVSVSVSWLVPKPFTPMQWSAQREPDYFRHVYRKLKRLQRSCRLPVKIKTHNIERSVLEAVFARGDRRLGPVVQRAWRNGARFDAWDETFSPRIWQEAFEKEGIDPSWYAHRDRSPDEVFPWDHIAGPDKSWLRREYEDIFKILQRRLMPGCPHADD